VNKQKILILSYRDLQHPEMGGAEIIIHEIYRRLQAAGHQVTFLTCRFPGCSPRARIDGMEVIRIGNLYNFNFEVGRYFRRHLARDGYTVLVEDLNKLPFYGPAFQKKLPVLVNIPHLFGRTVFSEAIFPLALYVYLQEQTIPRIYRHCHFQVLSDSTREDLIRRGLSPDRIFVVRSGIDHGYYVPPPGGRTPPKPVLLYLGRLKKYKCIEFPIRILSELRAAVPGAEYWIVGEGDYRPELERIARECGVAGSVRLLGFKDGAEKLEILHRSRVLLYTSPKEGWGLSVIEGNATGLPCVASDSPGLRESVQHGQTGFLVPHGDLGALRERVQELLTDDELWRRMSTAGEALARRYDWDVMARETLELIETATGRVRTGSLAGSRPQVA